jgi:hypothetical protein
MSSGFRRGCFETASVVHGERTIVRPVEEHDVDLLVARHDGEEVARYCDDERFTRAEMLERLARADVTPYEVSRHGPDDEHTSAWSPPRAVPYPVR